MNVRYTATFSLSRAHTSLYCLGSIDLILPYHVDAGRLVRFMLLNRAGQRLCRAHPSEIRVMSRVVPAFEEIHEPRVIHRDTELRNAVYDLDSGKVLIIDLEQAKRRAHRKIKNPEKYGMDCFAKEMQ